MAIVDSSITTEEVQVYFKQDFLFSALILTYVEEHAYVHTGTTNV